MPVVIRKKTNPTPYNRRSKAVSAIEEYDILARDICAFWRWISKYDEKLTKTEISHRIRCMEHQIRGAEQVTRNGDLADERAFIIANIELQML